MAEEISPDDPAVSRLGIPGAQEGGDRHPSGSLSENFTKLVIFDFIDHDC
jgi:hypothetical protein